MLALSLGSGFFRRVNSRNLLRTKSVSFPYLTMRPYTMLSGFVTEANCSLSCGDSARGAEKFKLPGSVNFEVEDFLRKCVISRQIVEKSKKKEKKSNVCRCFNRICENKLENCRKF